MHSPGPGQGQLLRDKTRMEGVKKDGGERGYALLDPTEARSCPREWGACKGSRHQHRSRTSWSNSCATKQHTGLKGDRRSPAERGRQRELAALGSCHRHCTHELPAERPQSFPAACLQFPEAQKRAPGADAATGRGAASPGSTPAVPPAHHSQCPAQARPFSPSPMWLCLSLPCRGTFCPKEWAQTTAGTSRYPGKELGLCNHPCQGWGPACPMSPFAQARGNPGHGHGLGQSSEKPIFAFLLVNPQAEECGVTTCMAPRGVSCVWRDTGMSPFGCAIYFLNICGRK